MKSRLWLLFIGFILFFHLIHLVQDMPNLVNGSPRFDYIPEGLRRLVNRVAKIILFSFFALAPYIILFRYYERSPVLSFVFVALAVSLLFFISYFADPGAGRLRFYFLDNIFYSIIYTVFGIVFFFLQYARFRENQAKELQLLQRQSEISFLRSQINPHFLFNSLNNIYALVYEKSDKSLEAIAGFSELMRYMLYNNQDRISLAEELNYVRKYIGLQQLRHAANFNVVFDVQGESIPKTIAPLLLIPFIENAFKHGRFTRPEESLRISLINTEKEIYFDCLNYVKKGNKDQQGGIGLVNVRKRLELLYPGRHTLTITGDDDIFTVKLHLQND